MRLFGNFLFLTLLTFALAASNVGHHMGNHVYMQKCLYQLKNMSKLASHECDTSSKSINLQKVIVNSRSDDFHGKARALREIVISKIAKITVEIKAKASDKDKDIQVCTEKVRKIFQEKVNAATPKLEDDYKVIQRTAIENLDKALKTIVDIRGSISRRFSDAQSSLKICRDTSCMTTVTEKTNVDFESMQKKAKQTADSTDAVIQSYIRSYSDLLSPYSSQLNNIEKEAEQSLNKCLSGKSYFDYKN